MTKKTKDTLAIIVHLSILPILVLLFIGFTYLEKHKLTDRFLNPLFWILIGSFCLLGIAFFVILIIQIPLWGMTKIYLLRNLSDEDYEISQMRTKESTWLRCMMMYSDDKLEENLDNIADALYNHRVCKFFYFNIWMRV